MKKILTFAFTVILTNIASSQTCLEQGILFSNQSEIDSFPIHYPDCSHIKGNVEIKPNASQQIDLSPLKQITRIDSNLTIISLQLNSLKGLENLEYVGSDFYLNSFTLSNIDSLKSLDSIGGSFVIRCRVLKSIDGLSNLSNIEKEFKIQSDSIKSLRGLENINQINGLLKIEANNLINLIGLDNLNSVNGDLWLLGDSTSNLESLQGLENLNTIEGTLRINGFPKLKQLISLSGLSTLRKLNIGGAYLKNFNGLQNLKSKIDDINLNRNEELKNFEGLNYIPEIGFLWVKQNPKLTNFMGLDSLYSVSQIYLENNVNLINMVGLENLETISIDFHVFGSENLESFEGLKGLSRIGGGIYLFNPGSLKDFSGLQSLNNIGNVLSIQNSSFESFKGLEKIKNLEYLTIDNSSNFANFIGLDSLYTINNIQFSNNDGIINFFGLESIIELNTLSINLCDAINSLSGLENIKTDSISNEGFNGRPSIRISNNPLLNECNLTPICKALERPELVSEIELNSFGCSSVDEILEKCIVSSTYQINTDLKLILYPNPTYDILTIESQISDTIIIYDNLGRMISKLNIETGITQINLTNINSGFYTLKTMNDKSYKIIKI